MNTLSKKHGTKYKKVTADSGYESLENYLYLEENGQISFIKPQNYEQSKTKKYREQIGRAENMTYDEVQDSYICAEGRRLIFVRESPDRYSRRGAMVSYYRCENCKNCPQRTQCCKAADPEQPKEIRIRKKLKEKRTASLANITTEEGIYLRLCRSIQVEGAFGLIKNDFGFRRFLSTGKKNIRVELFFLAMALT